MNKIDELIEKLCPNGVEYKELWEITQWDKKFTSVHNEKQKVVISFKHISAQLLKKHANPNGNIKLLSTGHFNGYALENDVKEYINQGEVITIPSGGNANIKYYKGLFVDSGNLLASSINNQLYSLKYIYYFLQTKNTYIENCYRGPILKHPNMNDILAIKIPVPPLEIQNEIVSILDKFTDALFKLKELLKAELKARKKQYVYYREKLLSFGDEIPRKKLIDIASISRGKRVTKRELNKDEKYPVYQNSLAPMGYYQKYNYEKNKTYVISAGSAGEIGFCEENFWAADDCLVIHNLEKVLDKYVYYYLMTKQDYIRSNVRKASIPRLSKEIIENIEVPILSIEKQKEIVNILDRFDKFYNDIYNSIPAEIEARQKQYEYYRDKLLTFKELVIDE